MELELRERERKKKREARLREEAVEKVRGTRAKY